MICLSSIPLLFCGGREVTPERLRGLTDSHNYNKFARFLHVMEQNINHLLYIAM